ncbi:hypothetical protein EP47_09745 [Legionella norrlandica]|uniref:Uncharacterized protein n=1 Tax=Legionella norrlandica TaxID=1498499 RepID=A0A0A2STL8_9GAMM|nr:hypothetical protein [Legionella norrlandica]KGP62779.1 hypothetical protein EP47_09745 [Legionella norrlandica]
MEKILWSISALFLITNSFAIEIPESIQSSNKDLLPSPFPVYVIEGHGVINHAYPGAIKVFLPTDNSYKDYPGCYIACYSHNQGVYAISSTISVMGQIRVKGQYEARICQPDRYKNKDISTVNRFKQLCAEKIPSCHNNSCWAGGDTGGWFGIQ